MYGVCSTAASRAAPNTGHVEDGQDGEDGEDGHLPRSSEPRECSPTRKCCFHNPSPHPSCSNAMRHQLLEPQDSGHKFTLYFSGVLSSHMHRVPATVYSPRRYRCHRQQPSTRFFQVSLACLQDAASRQWHPRPRCCFQTCDTRPHPRRSIARSLSRPDYIPSNMPQTVDYKYRKPLPILYHSVDPETLCCWPRRHTSHFTAVKSWPTPAAAVIRCLISICT